MEEIQKTIAGFTDIPAEIDTIRSDRIKIIFDGIVPDEETIKKIETEGFFLFITLDDGYTYTFTKKNDSIILIGISDEDGHNFSFGRDGIDSLYDTIPAHDRLGDDEDIESIKLTETGLIVELDNVEYLILCYFLVLHFLVFVTIFFYH